MEEQELEFQGVEEEEGEERSDDGADRPLLNSKSSAAQSISAA